MDVIGMFVAALAGGLVAAALCEWASATWRARRQLETWPKVLIVRGARIKVFSDGMMVYRRADGTCWAENLRFRDVHFQYAEQTEPLDPHRELH